MLKLADAFEKRGDWVAAIGEYRKASLADASIEWRGRVIRRDDRNPQDEYKAAQQRLREHLTALRAAGKSSDAATIEAAIQAAQAGAGLSEQLDAAVQAGIDADRTRHFPEAIQHFREAVALAEKLQPHDARLVTALDYLGNNYMGQDFAAAEAAFQRELQVAQELFGPQSPNLTGPLQSLGRNALMQHNYATAEKFYFRAVEIDEKFFGEGSDKVADSLVQAAGVYDFQKDYAKTVPYLLRAIDIYETLYGKDSIILVTPLFYLCTNYERLGKLDKMEPCASQLVSVLEKEYGADSSTLLPALGSHARALRGLGRNDDAARLENRITSIRQASMKTNCQPKKR
jgi:tetratricopeptide (TPR) repeat protein